MTKKTETAILAGGCFWGVQDLLRKEKGVIETQVGYTGGHTENPTYPDICTGATGHAEAVQIIFNPTETSFENILTFFFKMHNPTTPNQQGNDIGTQYRSAIFFTSSEQKQIAHHVIQNCEASGKWPGKITTEVVAADIFYTAETEHQDYLEKNPNGYTCHWVRPEWTA